MSPELSEALRNEIRATLDGESFSANIARRVCNLAMAARDMCEAATDTEKLTRDEDGVHRILMKHDPERNTVSPELAEALRNEIRTALDADGGSFDVNVARRVYDLAIAARDMCVAATTSVKEAIDQIKDTNGPMETLDSSDTPEAQVQISESFGARILRELMATLPTLLQGPRGEDPKQLVHALAEARRNGMHDVAEQLEVKLFGRVLSGPRPITAEEADVEEGSYEHGFADGRAGALPESTEEAYREGYLKGTMAKYLGKTSLPTADQEAYKGSPPADAHAGASATDHSAAIARDEQLGRSSHEIRDEIIGEVGMMAYSRTPEMQARYAAALKREGKIDSMTGPITCPSDPAYCEACKKYPRPVGTACLTCRELEKVHRRAREFSAAEEQHP